MSSSFTFLIPAYKKEYLADVLDSIQQQTIDDFEVVISNDCSPYDLFSISKPYLSDSRFSYQENDYNIGAEKLVIHWNRLLDQCKSKYVIMASDDDIYDPNFLFEIRRCIEQFPNGKVFRPLIRIVDERTNDTKTESISLGEPKVFCLSEYLSMFVKGSIFSGLSQFVFERNALMGVGGFMNLPFGWFSDDVTVAKVVSGSGLVLCPKVLFSMRVWSQSITGRRSDSVVATGKLNAAVEYYDSMSSMHNIPQDVLKGIQIRTRNLTLSNYAESKGAPSGLIYFRLFLKSAQLFPFWWMIKQVAKRILNSIQHK